MKARLLRTSKSFNAGDRDVVPPEGALADLKFTVHRTSGRKRPEDPRRNLIVPCFSEFGCEVVAAMYCLPRLAQRFPGHYKTAVGWFGREYLYRHLVDEFWELDEGQMWLREYARAFHHESANLRRFEAGLRPKGQVVSSKYMGRIALTTECNACGRYWTATARSPSCGQCGGADLRHSLFSDPEGHRPDAVLPGPPSPDKVAYAESVLGPRPVAVFARNRRCYGRNLPAGFYADLVGCLRSLGYTPVWLGERVSTLPCPVPGVADLSQGAGARDLEATLAVVSRCLFTVQFWTASTRLAALAGVPYLLFESPDQLWGRGQEGYRLDLVTRGKRKVAVNHFLNVLRDPKGGLDLVRRCVAEMEAGDYSDVIGMVDDPAVVTRQRQCYLDRNLRP